METQQIAQFMQFPETMLNTITKQNQDMLTALREQQATFRELFGDERYQIKQRILCEIAAQLNRSQ